MSLQEVLWWTGGRGGAMIARTLLHTYPTSHAHMACIPCMLHMGF